MGISIRFARLEDVDELIHIWQVCFGDSISYITFFMEHCFHAENTVVACCDQKVVGVTYMLPATLQGQKFMYGYAVGVLPEYRGNHICKIMHEFIQTYAEKVGFIYGLHPANEKLFSFYRRIGLRDMYTLRSYDAPKTANENQFIIEDISAEEYDALRKKSFAPLVEWGNNMMHYIYLETKTYGGFVKKIIVGGKERILLGKQHDNKVIIKETTLTDDEINLTTPFLYRYFSAESIRFILPNNSTLGKRENMVLGFGEKSNEVYMNLFLDE